MTLTNVHMTSGDRDHRCVSGKVKAIGVSNFSQKKLEEILPTAEVVPAVDQVRAQRSSMPQPGATDVVA